MNTEKRCSSCGAILPPDSPMGLCVRCLLGTGLSGDTVLDPPTPTTAGKPGDRVGPYKLLQRLGEGGMGSVWMAEQSEPIRRVVALKLIKAGMDSAQVLARFEVERQALALMDHPNTAKVLDAGSTPEGRPYFVMELVKGIPLTKFCDEQRLSIRERLELFLPVCQTIQHAHHKGIIHRDIKPSNVLVGLYDGRPVPKVIDFGIAKATGLRLTERTFVTEFGALVGTPEYMSPEQAEMNQLDIDTRSDIYSLGVLLYELLTGSTPLTREALCQAAFDEVLRRIREEETPRPSTRLSQSKDRLPTISAQRKLEPRQLMSAVRKDLDWVVMMALEKERNRRYPTANEFAQDLQRFLNNEPVIARPPSPLYRLEKLVRRNRLAVAAAGAVVAAVVLGAAISVWQASEAMNARESEKVQRLAAQEERDKAQTARALAEQKAEDEKRAKAEAEIQQKLAKSAQQSAELLLARNQLQTAESRFKGDDSQSAVAYLADFLRQSPTNNPAAERLMNALTVRNFVLPVRDLPSVKSRDNAEAKDIKVVQFSPDGLRIATIASNGVVRLWDTLTAQPLPEPLQQGPESMVTFLQFSPEGQMVVTVTVPLGDQRAPPPPANLRVVSPYVEESEGPPADADLDEESDTPPMDPGDGQPSEAHPPQAVSTVRLWDANTGRSRGKPIELPGAWEQVRVASDGRRIVGVSRKGEARLWDTSGGQVRTQAWEIPVAVESAEFSANGRRILTVSSGREARVWDVETGREVGKPVHLNAARRSVLCSPDGQRILTVFFDGTVQIWDSQSGLAIAQLQKPHPAIQSAGFSPDGRKILTTAVDGSARIWDAGTGQPRSEPVNPGRPCQQALFCRDGRQILTIFSDYSALLWDACFAGVLPETVMKGPNVESVHFSPDGLRMLTISTQGMVRVWAGGAPQPVFDLEIRLSLRSAVSPPLPPGTPAGPPVAAAGQPRTNTIRQPGRFVSAQFSSDRQRIWTADAQGRIETWDAHTGDYLTNRPLQRLSGLQSLKLAEFSRDGRRIGTVSRGVPPLPPANLLLKPLGSRGSTDTLCVWECTTGQPVSDPISTGDRIRSIGLSPDGLALLTVSEDGKARIWGVTNGLSAAKVLSHEGVSGAQFSVDGLKIVTASSNRTARVWDARTGSPLSDPLEHEQGLVCADFSVDGQRILTASATGILRIWDVRTAQPLSDPIKERGPISRARFSPDGRCLVTVSHHGVRTWALPPVPSALEPWLLELAEAVAGKRFEQSDLKPVPTTKLLEIRREVEQRPDTNRCTRWAKWVLDRREVRMIAPESSTTLDRCVASLIEEDTSASLEEAVSLSPANALAWARLGSTILRREGTNDLSRNAEADWCAERALSLGPPNIEVLRAAARAWQMASNFVKAADALEKAAALDPQSPDLWRTRGVCLEKANRLEDACAALSKAIEVGAKDDPPLAKEWRQALLDRARVRKQLGRTNEAQADWLLAMEIPQRDPRATRNQVDLAQFYNASLRGGCEGGSDATDHHNSLGSGLQTSPVERDEVEWPCGLLADLTTGLQTLAGTTFELRGIVLLDSRQFKYTKQPNRPQYPQDVEGIAVTNRFNHMHFLHGAVCPSKDDTEIGRYAIHLADGTVHEMPIRYGRDVRHWLFQTNSLTETSGGTVAWRGTQDRLKKSAGWGVRLYTSTWTNPHPEIEIRSVDFASGMEDSAPFLLGITGE